MLRQFEDEPLRVGEDVLVLDEVARRAYECDAFTMYRALPLVVALPENVEQTRAIMALAAEMNVKIVPRGADRKSVV